MKTEVRCFGKRKQNYGLCYTKKNYLPNNLLWFGIGLRSYILSVPHPVLPHKWESSTGPGKRKNYQKISKKHKFCSDVSKFRRQSTLKDVYYFSKDWYEFQNPSCPIIIPPTVFLFKRKPSNLLYTHKYIFPYNQNPPSTPREIPPSHLLGPTQEAFSMFIIYIVLKCAL